MTIFENHQGHTCVPAAWLYHSKILPQPHTWYPGKELPKPEITAQPNMI